MTLISELVRWPAKNKSNGLLPAAYAASLIKKISKIKLKNINHFFMYKAIPPFIKHLSFLSQRFLLEEYGFIFHGIILFIYFLFG
jgi:hypothetical protein